MPTSAKARAGLGDTIRQFSTPKQTRKTAFVLPAADYETVGSEKDRKRHHSDMLAYFEKSRDSEAEAVEYA